MPRVKIKRKSPEPEPRGLSLSRGAVIRTLNRFLASQIPWPLPEGITGEALEKVLYKAPRKPKSISVTLPTEEDLASAHHELTQNKHLTLKLLYDEWNDANRIHLSYSRFCHYYQQYKKSLGRSFSNTYIGGEYSFIEFSGDSIGLTLKGGGDKIKTELFVWCFGASNMTYWEFVESQKQEELHKAMEHGHGAWHGVFPMRIQGMRCPLCLSLVAQKHDRIY